MRSSASRRADVQRGIREGSFTDFGASGPVLDEGDVIAAEYGDTPGYYELHDERCGSYGWDCRKQC